MPVIHVEPFRVRHYECDAFGHLAAATYLRWMQESAFAASAAVGYGFAQYHRIGQLWLIRDTTIDYLSPLRYGDEVEVKTWVMDFRRFRSLRAYEVRNIKAGGVAARASTDWVYLDTETFRPLAVPEAMQSAFFPEGAPTESLPRDRYSPSLPSLDSVFSLRMSVTWSDVDMMWHVNNARYLEYVEDIEKRACTVCGWPMERMMAEGFRIYPRQQRIEYLRPAVLGDDLDISTWCSDVTDTKAFRHYEIRRVSDGELLVRVRALWGLVDLQTGAARRIPEELAPAC